MRARAIVGAMLLSLSGATSGCRNDKPAAPPVATAKAAPKPGPLPAPLVEVLKLNGAGRFEDARGQARAYIDGNPDDGRGWLMLAMTYHKAGNYQPAVAHFERALELSPDYYLTRRYFGECLFMLGDLAGARRQYEALVAADPEDPEAHCGIGTVDLEETRLAEAETRFRKAIALYEEMRAADPRRFAARRADAARAHARLADVHLARGEYAAARDELIASTALEPGHISAFHALSLVYRRLGQDDLADQALARYESAKAAIIESAGGGG